MSKFLFKIKELQTGFVEVEADNYESAKELAMQEYHDGNTEWRDVGICVIPHRKPQDGSFKFTIKEVATGCVCIKAGSLEDAESMVLDAYNEGDVEWFDYSISEITAEEEE